MLGKFAGHLGILGFATVVGYGVAGLALQLAGDEDAGAWAAFALMVASSVLLGGVFVAIGYLVSTLVRDRGAAGGVADRRLAVLRAALRHGAARRAGRRPGPHGDGGRAERAAAAQPGRRLSAAQPDRARPEVSGFAGVAGLGATHRPRPGAAHRRARRLDRRAARRRHRRCSRGGRYETPRRSCSASCLLAACRQADDDAPTRRVRARRPTPRSPSSAACR